MRKLILKSKLWIQMLPCKLRPFACLNFALTGVHFLGKLN